MMILLAMPPGDMFSCAAILLVVGPGLAGVPGGLVGVGIEASILLVVGPRLTDAWVTTGVEGFAVAGA
jgi:hypothetical protein